MDAEDRRYEGISAEDMEARLGCLRHVIGENLEAYLLIGFDFEGRGAAIWEHHTEMQRSAIMNSVREWMDGEDWFMEDDNDENPED